MNLIHTYNLDSKSVLTQHFMPHQLAWIEAEQPIHEQRRQVVALAEKSVRIGWTYADAFKNVRKRIWFKDRDYLFATKDYPSALEYVRQCYRFAEIFDLTRSIKSHGEEYLSVNRTDEEGRPTSFTEHVKIGVIKFDNGSRIIAFSANPQAMSVYGGDVGLDEFAKHPNARVLWETAQGRVTWNYDLAVWSSHDGEDTLFNEFAQEARAACRPSAISLPSSLPFPGGAALGVRNEQPALPDSALRTPHSTLPQPSTLNLPWNIYFHVTMLDAIHNGLVDTINRARGTKISPKQFLADCRARARDEEMFQQSYMCNPMGAAANRIVEWSAIERCRADYQIERTHLEAEDVRRHFGEFVVSNESAREEKIESFLRAHFPRLLAKREEGQPKPKYRLGFDVAASGEGDLACIYIDEAKGDVLWLRALLTCRTEDWHFLKTALFHFLRHLPNLRAAGDESGLGRQICWEAGSEFPSRFLQVNFGGKKQDLGFALMNQLSVAEKRFPKSEPDIAADYFALQKAHNGSKWAFSEGRNTLNVASHCDIAWAGALATHAHTEKRVEVGVCVLHENGWFDGKNFYPYGSKVPLSREAEVMWSDDPQIWKRWI